MTHEEAWLNLLESVPLEKRLAGLTLEQRLAGLASEERLALAGSVLRRLPESYVRTLPADEQETIRRLRRPD